jgi:hypothetical protein
MNLSNYKNICMIATETPASHLLEESVKAFDEGGDGISNYDANRDAMYVEHGSCPSDSYKLHNRMKNVLRRNPQDVYWGDVVMQPCC